MPELPEVETIARFLREGGRDGPSILGETIQSTRLFWTRTLATAQSADELDRQLAGQSIHEIGRRGKFLILTLNKDTLLFHLRMSGDLRVEPTTAPAAPHDRFWLVFRSGNRLTFNDPRKFGRVWLVRDPDEVLSGLGLEPLARELTREDFFAMLHGRNRQLKPLLLDQAFLAGLGNIYADEALHVARLHPLRLASSLTRDEAGALLRGIRIVLDEGIASQGASIDWVYRGGSFQDRLRVYQRTGEPCRNCGTPIVRITVGQRGTHYCPTCQADTVTSST